MLHNFVFAWTWVYELEIVLAMGGTCCSCSDNPTCRISMFLQPPLVPYYNQIQPPAGWNPTVYKERAFDVPNTVYTPYDANAYQQPMNFNYGQNAEASSDSDEPVGFLYL